MDIERIKQLSREEKLRWTDHIFKRMLKRNISMSEIQEAIQTGKIIEEYPTDYPYPSCLLIGICMNGKKIHIVCSINTDDSELWLITAYEPDPTKWNSDFTIRKEG